MDLIQRRREIIAAARDPNIIYEETNLSFNNTVINTGVYLFTAENINRDFEFIAENINGNGDINNTIICAKHDGKAYGFLVRIYNSTSASYNGTIFVTSGASIVIKRINGVITLSGTNIANPDVKFTNGIFDWPLVLGCAIDDKGDYFRYKTGTIGHVLVKWL